MVFCREHVTSCQIEHEPCDPLELVMLINKLVMFVAFLSKIISEDDISGMLKAKPYSFRHFLKI